MADEALRQSLACDNVRCLIDGFEALLMKVECLTSRNAELIRQLKAVQTQNNRIHKRASHDYVSTEHPQINKSIDDKPQPVSFSGDRKEGYQRRCISNDGNEKPRIEETPWYEDERIRSGIHALKYLRAQAGEQGPTNPQARVPAPVSVTYTTEATSVTPGDKLAPRKQDLTTKDPLGELGCPLASKAAARQQSRLTSTSSIQGRFPPSESLLTPLDTKEGLLHDSITAEFHEADSDLLPPSASGSASNKCPIRFLDQHSPEELARYFTLHKHEIPRSHELCVKRYQTNEESIRKLDAKYGNLVSMIQELGVKHQSMLATKDDEEAEEDAADLLGSHSKEKVEKWATNCTESVDAVEETVFHPGEARSGHFDRTLKDVRVGESPSRPWGISVPYTEGLALSSSPNEDAEMEPIESGLLSRTASSLPSEAQAAPSEFAKCPLNRGNAGATSTINYFESIANHKLGCSDETTKESEPTKKQAAAGAEPRSNSQQIQPNIVFNGPIFVGYSAEEAATLLQNYIDPTTV